MAAVAFLASLLLPAAESRAGTGGPSFIRDAEIEHIIRVFATPAWVAAGLTPASVKIYLIDDPAVNSFVADGQNIFVQTGLLLKVRNPSELIGVLAHETGHIADGHLVRGAAALHQASVLGVASLLLGAAAVVAGGGGDNGVGGGVAIMAGGMQVAGRSYLQYSRNQESQADNAAVTFLDRSHQSAEGLLTFLKLLGQEEKIMVGTVDPYLLTHPLSEERIAALQERVDRSPYRNSLPPPAYTMMLHRVQAKITGFLDPLATTLKTYPESDQSLPARYARAIAYYRVPELDKALGLIDGLIGQWPDDPYFHELKGQMLYENGRAAEAVAPYAAAVKAAPDEPLLRYELGQAQLATNDPALLDPAITTLTQATIQDPDNASAWYQLSVAYGRADNLPMANLAAAERSLRLDLLEDAHIQATSAQAGLPFGSPAALRAEDIVSTTSREIADRHHH